MLTLLRSKAQAASAQSFTLWQQITIEITCHDHSSCTLVVTFNRSHASIMRDYMPRSLCYCLFVPHIQRCCSSRTSRSWRIAHSMQPQWIGCNNIPSFSQRTALIACSFCEGCTWHNLHILVTAPYCYDLKARVASAQSITLLWQQATIEITCHDHSSCTLVVTFNRSHANMRDYMPQSLLLLLVHATYIWGLFFTHIPFVVNHTFNATARERLRKHHCQHGQVTSAVVQEVAGLIHTLVYSCIGFFDCAQNTFDVFAQDCMLQVWNCYYCTFLEGSDNSSTSHDAVRIKCLVCHSSVTDVVADVCLMARKIL